MDTKALLLRGSIGIALLTLIPATTASARQNAHLVVDGKLKVKGASLEGARMVMVDGSGNVLVMEQGLEHFTVPMDYNANYLMAFERAGCVSKQVLFDTSLPFSASLEEERTFLFEVTLMAPPEGQQFVYAGPVAQVHYVASIHDFGYDTDYRVKTPPLLLEHMARAQAGERPARDRVVVVEPIKEAAHAPATSAEPERHAEREMPLVHRTGAGPAVRAEPARAAVPAIEVKRVVRPAPTPAPVRAKAPQPEVVAPVPAATADQVQQRQDEVVVEHLRVTHIARIRQGDRITEYRRVETRYGQVYYFRDGGPVPASTYFTAVGR
ncbi:MAG: hypothetical protein JNL05_03880 [Flavobacteriales bacterium]|nr:hypothetical protein [Flavobacteriales bacterium]